MVKPDSFSSYFFFYPDINLTSNSNCVGEERPEETKQESAREWQSQGFWGAKESLQSDAGLECCPQEAAVGPQVCLRSEAQECLNLSADSPHLAGSWELTWLRPAWLHTCLALWRDSTFHRICAFSKDPVRSLTSYWFCCIIRQIFLERKSVFQKCRRNFYSFHKTFPAVVFKKRKENKFPFKKENICSWEQRGKQNSCRRRFSGKEKIL